MTDNITPVGGLLLIDKPAGLSSNQVLGKAKRILGIRKAGHAGTLDPFATGLLLCAFGQATRVNAFLLETDKHYLATLKLGQSTATGDTEGEAVDTAQVPAMNLSQWQEVADTLVGEIEQVPPMYSALKYQGTRLYELARKGETVPRQARKVTIKSLQGQSWEPPLFSFEVHCSKGTYVRTLGEQLATLSGSLGHLVALRRTASGGFNIGQAITLDALAEMPDPKMALLAADRALLHLAEIELDREQTLYFQQGRVIVQKHCVAGDQYRVYDADHCFIGIGIGDRQQQLQPQRVFSALK